MSLVRMTRRRRSGGSPEKPHADRIEHANLERPGARPHPRAVTPPLETSRNKPGTEPDGKPASGRG